MRHQYISNIKPGQYCDIVEWCNNGNAKCVLTTYSRTGRAKQVTKYLPEYCFKGPYRSYDRV